MNKRKPTSSFSSSNVQTSVVASQFIFTHNHNHTTAHSMTGAGDDSHSQFNSNMGTTASNTGFSNSMAMTGAAAGGGGSRNMMQNMQQAKRSSSLFAQLNKKGKTTATAATSRLR